MADVQVRGVRLHYDEVGGGPEPLVFVGGFISSRRWWTPVLEHLDGGRYRGLALDLRGTGESEDGEGPFTIAGFADDLAAFAEALGLERFGLVGHSLGGGIALRHAIDHPGRLGKLVLADPLAPFGTRLTPEVTAWTDAQVGQPDGIRALIVGGMVHPIEGPYLEDLVADGLRWGPGVYLGMMRDMERFDVVSRLEEIAVPTLVTWADGDVVIPFEGIIATYQGIPGAGLEVWHGVGHDTILEAPQRFADLLQRFLAEA